MNRKPSPLAVAIFLALATSPALAIAQEHAREAKTLDTLIVTGTRVADRTVAESSVPDRHHHPRSPGSHRHHRTGDRAVARPALAELPAPGHHRRHRCGPAGAAARPVARPGAGAGQRQAPPHHGADQPQRQHRAAVLRRSTSTPSRSPPSNASKCCATAPRRNTVPTPSPAWSTSCSKGSGEGGSLARRYGQYSAGDGEQYQLSGDAGLGFGDDRGFRAFGRPARPNRTTPTAPGPTWAARITATPATTRTWAKSPSSMATQGGCRRAYRPMRVSPSTTTSMPTRLRASNRDMIRSRSSVRRTIAARAHCCPDLSGRLPAADQPDHQGPFAGGRRQRQQRRRLDLDLSYNYGHNRPRLLHPELPQLQSGPRPAPHASTTAPLEYTQNVLNADFTKSLEVGLAYPAQPGLRRRMARREIQRIARRGASYINGGVPSANGALLPAHRFSPASSPRDAGQLRPPQLLGVRRPGSRPHRQVLRRHRRPLRKLSATSATPALGQAVGCATRSPTSRVARHGVHRLPRAVAAAAVLPVGRPRNFINGARPRQRHGCPRSKSAPSAPTILPQSPWAPSRCRPRNRRTYSLGLVLQPVDRLYVTVDAYRSTSTTASCCRRTSPRRRGAQLPAGQLAITGHRRRSLLHQRHRHQDHRHRCGGHYTIRPGHQHRRPHRRLQLQQDRDRQDRAQPGLRWCASIPTCAVRIGRAEIGRISKVSPNDKFFLGATWIQATGPSTPRTTR